MRRSRETGVYLSFSTENESRVAENAGHVCKVCTLFAGCLEKILIIRMLPGHFFEFMLNAYIESVRMRVFGVYNPA
jgi:hypothetical protein